MSALLMLARLGLPSPVVKRRLRRLCALTADAFGNAYPEAGRVSRREMLERYARYTREQASAALARGDGERVRARLYRNAFFFGDEIRRAFRLRTHRDALMTAEILYRALNIDLRGDGQNGVVIGRCFFSSYYTAEVCALISALDEGLFAGLFPGMKLRFVARLTEGGECCRASLRPGEGGCRRASPREKGGGS